MDERTKFVAEWEHMMRRAERNVQLFHNVAWESHLETVQDSDLPRLEGVISVIEENMEIFADDPDELSRLEDCLEFAKRQIVHIKNRQQRKRK